MQPLAGSLNALLDASLGMNIELTGRENIMLRGLYNGLPRPSLARLEEDVAMCVKYKVPVIITSLRPPAAAWPNRPRLIREPGRNREHLARRPTRHLCSPLPRRRSSAGWG